MAQGKESVLLDTEKHEWRIIYRAANGDEKVRDAIPQVERMDSGEAISMLQGMVDKAPKKRRAALSLLVEVLKHKLPDLSEWQGKGDKSTGQISNELKEEFRKAEDSYFGQFMDKGHARHTDYVKRLPKLNERGQPLVGADGEENPRARHNYFVGALRKDSSYAVAKNMMLNFWAFVGNVPFDDETGTILPPEVMRIMAQNAKDVKAADRSWAQRFTDVCRELVVPTDPAKPTAVQVERLAALIADGKAAVAELERRQRMALGKNAEQGAPEPKPESVNAQAGTMIERAQSAARVNMTPDEPKSAVKDTEPAQG